MLYPLEQTLPLNLGEIRSSKPEIRIKSELRNPKPETARFSTTLREVLRGALTLEPEAALTIRRAETERQMQDFLEVFCAAYQTQPHPYAAVFGTAPGSSEELRLTRTEHFIAYRRRRTRLRGQSHSTGDTAGIYNVGTAPRARKKGFAAQLTAHLVRHAQETGIKRLFLQAERGSNAERIYTQLGFRTAFVRTGYRLAQWQSSLPTLSRAENWNNRTGSREVC